MITTARRVEYARGYLELGLLAEAARELALISAKEKGAVEVIEVHVELYTRAKRWSAAAALAEKVVQAKPDEPGGWISWAYATRRDQDISSAEQILLRAEKRLGGTCGMIHYNLACYRCQQGDLEGAKERLTIACRLEPIWKTAALEDADLVPLKSYVASL